MSLIDISEPARANPLEVVERMAATNDWSFERAGDDEITLLVRGKWTDYQVSFTWMYDIEALHLACAFEFKVPDRLRSETQQLLAMINEQLWVGHFDLWVKDGLIMYRHALVLAGGVEASGGRPGRTWRSGWRGGRRSSRRVPTASARLCPGTADRPGCGASIILPPPI